MNKEKHTTVKDEASAQRCLWEATAVPGPQLKALEGPEDAQVVVVGAGIAGLGTALQLAQRGVRCVVLEAATVGAGASGRCGGQVLYGARQTRLELQAQFGAQAGARVHALGAAAAERAFALIRSQGLRCDASQAGSIYAADSAAGLAEVRAKFSALRAAGVDAQFLERQALSQRLGSDAYCGAYFNPLAGSVQPLSLVRELARVALAAGASIYERSSVLSIARHGADWCVRTERGQVVARRVLLATNGRAAGRGWCAR